MPCHAKYNRESIFISATQVSQTIAYFGVSVHRVWVNWHAGLNI